MKGEHATFKISVSCNLTFFYDQQKMIVFPESFLI